jgi:hypothetical protein
MRLFILLLFFALSYGFSNDNKKRQTLTIEKKINDRTISIVLKHKKNKKQNICFYDDFYTPEWGLESLLIKVNNNIVFTKLDVLYCLLQDVSDISISYKNEYYVMDVSGGDGDYGNCWELWFDDKRIKKTIVFGNAEKSDTTAIIVHKEVVYN